MALFRKKPKASKAELDAGTLSAMVKRGAVLSNRRNVRHFLYGSDELAVSRAAGVLEAQGYSVRVGPAATAGQWGVVAEREEVVDAASVAGVRALLEGLAADIPGGDYDGWEAAVVEK